MLSCIHTDCMYTVTPFVVGAVTITKIGAGGI